jgi:hypothetical protein
MHRLQSRAFPMRVAAKEASIDVGARNSADGAPENCANGTADHLADEGASDLQNERCHDFELSVGDQATPGKAKA